MTITERDATILAQVAFKAAVDLLPGCDVLDDAQRDVFERTTVALTDILVASVSLSTDKHANGQPTGMASLTGESKPTSAPKPSGDGSKLIIGDIHGPIPDWLEQAMKEKGVDRVYDNRDRLKQPGANPNLPWFRSPKNEDGKDIPFWPPKAQS